LRLVTSNIDVEVRLKKVSAEGLVPQPTIVMRTEDGRLVEAKRVTPNGEVLETYHWRYFTEDGEEISPKEIHYFQVMDDGSEREVRPFDRTSIINVVKEVPRASVEGLFIIEGIYELFVRKGKKTKEDEYQRDLKLLYEEAERYYKNDLAGLAVFSWGRGFKQYYAIIHPVFRDNKFVWVMSLTRSKIVYQNMMEPPAVRAPIPQPPTIEMPPIETLIS